ncbi:MAG: proline--tRNA ligase, partial [Schwartzia sp.]|nr:proline--tRNA ligase [Schwartzia sp. (in: firmicutes)]
LELAEQIYSELKAVGVDVLLDDRKERAGVKFKDCDLIGYPLRVTVGPKTVEEGTIELRVRKTGETFVEAKDNYLAKVLELVEKL